MYQRSCSICSGDDFEVISSFQFGGWKKGEAAVLERINHTYDILSCNNCSHIMADVIGGEEFVNSLYGDSIGLEKWDTGDYDQYAPYRDMVIYCQKHLDVSHLDVTHLDVSHFDIANLDTVVDFGSGNGELLHVLHHDFAIPKDQLLGVDFSNNLADDLPFLEGNLNHLSNLPDSKAFAGFSLGFCCHVLEHLWQPQNIMKELRKRASDDSYLYVEVPDHGILNDNIIKHSNLFNSQHINYFTLNSLKNLASKCGWQVVAEESQIFGFTPRAKLLLKPGKQKLSDIVLNQEVNGIDNAIACMKAYDEIYARAAKIILNAACKTPVDIWGVGGDLVKIMFHEPLIYEAMTQGQINLYDNELKGKKFNGILIGDPKDISVDENVEILTTVFISPRPERTREVMVKCAQKMGILKTRIVEIYV